MYTNLFKLSDPIRAVFAPLGLVLLALVVILTPANHAQAAERADVARFLEVTGFDVALESMGLGAKKAPEMLGRDPGDFGIMWNRVVEDVMRPAEIVATATDMLEQTLNQEMLDHALDFYGSALGQQVVRVENASHMIEDEASKSEAGQEIVSALVRVGAEGSARLDYLRRMNNAVDSDGMSLRAVQEIQIRFLLTAAAHGVIALQMDEKDMRAFFRQQETQTRAAIMANAMANAAYTYQSLSDEELRQYTEALEAPQMQEVYRLVNAIQFEITAHRYEILAARMADLRPSEEL
ncbi:DUF2059 domain-containing protein [Thalassovita sp.]|jgi:hypothetical protein|uniref:DUF2059 domain-containing protein n=1 Tax=Thalassovita sp. TaxID=1979401 RepID=UPI003B5BB570